MHIPDLEESSDEDLARAFTAQGDRDALEVLLRRHEKRVYGLAYRMLGNRADALEVTQEVLLNVFRKLSSFKHQSAFTTWLYRLTMNACNDLGRKRARTPVPVEVLEKDQPDSLAHSDDRLAVQRALSTLIPDQRAAVVMRDLYGLSYEEIAAATRVPLGTVKSRIARARAALAEVLKEPPSGEGRLSGQDP